MQTAIYAGTEKVYYEMYIAMKSLLFNSSVQKIYFLIEDDKFPYKLPKQVELINVKNQRYFSHNGPNYNSGWTYMILLRAAYSKMFPCLNKVLSLDVDTIVCKNINSLWQIPLNDYYLAGVREPGHIPLNEVYVNMGVTMMNLQKLRSTGIDNELIYRLNTIHYACPEQDCFYEVCKGKILAIDPAYNVCGWTENTGRCIIKHYAGVDAWYEDQFVKYYIDLKIPE